MRKLSLLILPFIFLIIMGCNGSIRHEVNTGGDGSLEGMVISPEPQTLDLNFDDTFIIYWPDGFEPPSTFQVKLESIDKDGTKTGIYTELKTLTSQPNYYELDPGSLDSQTFYLLTITSDQERVRAMYLTDGFLLSPARTARTLTNSKLEHTVTRGIGSK